MLATGVENKAIILVEIYSSNYRISKSRRGSLHAILQFRVAESVDMTLRITLMGIVRINDAMYCV